MRLVTVAAALAALALGGCGPASEPADKPLSFGGPCPDDTYPLEGTGLCRTEAFALLDSVVTAEPPPAPDACGWDVRDALLSENEAILYRAIQCEAGTASLKAEDGVFRYAQTAFYGVMPGWELIQVFDAPAADPQSVLRARIAEIEDPAERAACVIDAPGYEGWPADALVIRLTREGRARLPLDEPHRQCGPFGLDEDQSNYWRLFQGKAWFFQLGQEQTDVDADSVTLIRRTGPGADWRVVGQ